MTVKELVATCLGGTSLLVEVCGDPGTGRTRLLGELAAEARRNGLAVVQGAHAVPPPGRGVVRCLDDLDRADAGTVERLPELLTRTPPVPTVIAYTAPPRPLPARLASCLAEADAAYASRRIVLGPLDPAAFAARLPPGTGPVREALLYELSGGLPGWLAVLEALTGAQLAELASTGLTTGPLALPTDCPALRELTALDAELTEVVRGAAVLGDPFSPQLVAAVAERDASAVLPVIDELVARDVVRGVDGGAPLFRFRHPLLRALLYAGTPPGRRISAHARAAAALHRVGAPAVQRAPHVARSAEQGDRAAADLLARAAQEVLDTRPALAAIWLRAALRVLPDDTGGGGPDGAGGTGGTEPGVRYRIEALLYHAAERTGQFAECRSLLPALLKATWDGATAESCVGGLFDRGLIVDLQARLEFRLGRRAAARGLVSAELTAGFPHAPRTERVLRLRMAAMAALEGDLPGTREHLREACLPAAPPHDVLTMDAAASLGLARAMADDTSGQEGPGGPSDAQGAEDGGPEAAELTSAARTAAVLSPAVLADRLDAVARTGWALNLSGRHRDAERLLTRGLDTARRVGRVSALPPLLLGRGYGRAALGDLAAALHDAREAEETALTIGDHGCAGWARLLRAWIALWCDGPGDAADLACRVLREHPAPGALGTAAAGVAGWARLASGRPEECLELVLPAARDTNRLLPAAVRVAWWSAAAVAAAELGRDATARHYSAMAAAAAAAGRRAGPRAEALCAQARQVPDATAVVLLSAAVELSADAGLLVLECRARLALAQRLTALCRLEDAAAQAGLAKEGAARAGARWLRQVAIDTQRRIGACRPRRASAAPSARLVPGGGMLSAREEQIVGMVCQGMSNRDMATALFVSVKTVESHLTRIFRKTGARSRVSLVAAFAAGQPADA